MNANCCFHFQIIFDGFTVGRFDEGLVDSEAEGYEANFNPTSELPGCPEGFMQVGGAFFIVLFFSEICWVYFTGLVFLINLFRFKV